jgi:hypothetical protein
MSSDSSSGLPKKPLVIEGVGSATGEAATVVATATFRMNFAVQHMLAAARFSRQVLELEREHQGEAFGPFFDDILHHATACIFAASASLEAYANELFFDRATAFPDYSSELLDKLWEIFEQKPTLDKFGFALLLRDRPKMDRGARPYQDVTALIELRNALTHFKPEWDNEAVRHRDVSERLRGRFIPSSFLDDALIFPRAWATHGCTKWAVESCLAFATEFERLAQLPVKYARGDLRS